MRVFSPRARPDRSGKNTRRRDRARSARVRPDRARGGGGGAPMAAARGAQTVHNRCTTTGDNGWPWL